jgi:hypothetical protein
MIHKQLQASFNKSIRLRKKCTVPIEYMDARPEKMGANYNNKSSLHDLKNRLQKIISIFNIKY